MISLTWFGKLSRYSPVSALIIGRALLILCYLILAPIEAIVCIVKEIYNFFKRVIKSSIKPFKGFVNEWHHITNEVDYWNE